MAGIFGSKELELETTSLICHFIGAVCHIAGAAIFSSISKKYGDFTALKTTIVIWGWSVLLLFC